MEPQHIDEILERIPVQLSFKGTKTRTKSEFADEANINNIVKRCMNGAAMPTGGRTPLFGDFTEVADFSSAQTLIAQANAEFEQLPSNVREKFGNDVSKLMDFLDDENNLDEAIELGLAPKPEPEPKTIDETAHEAAPEPTLSESEVSG
jgi:phage internal scaffolding protein